MVNSVDFRVQLSKQLGFLERSCQSYDAGFTDEAIRIATVIRVTIHQTKNSTSLLKHMGATTINLLSTTSSNHALPIHKANYFMGMGMVVLNGDNAKYISQLGDGPTKEFIPVIKWWNQIVMVLEAKHQITRKDIVLAAANKDGGAHVDAKLTSEYAALAKDGAVGSFVYESAGNKSASPIEGAHLMSLRQMGYELLHSPQLLALCND